MLDLLKLFTDSLLNTLIVPGLFAGSILILFGWFIPTMFAQYKVPAIMSGIILVLFFTFQSGKYVESSSYKLEQAETKAELQRLNAKSKDISHEVVIEYIEKIKYVDRWKEVPINVYIPEKANAQCIIDSNTGDTFRMLFNSSLEGQLPSTPK